MGYYDKQPFGHDDRYTLGMRTTFEQRTRRPDDRIDIGMLKAAQCARIESALVGGLLQSLVSRGRTPCR